MNVKKIPIQSNVFFGILSLLYSYCIVIVKQFTKSNSAVGSMSSDLSEEKKEHHAGQV
jgi:hypothetical protein